VRRLSYALAVIGGVCLAVAAGSLGRTTADAHWRSFAHAPGVVDVVGPRADGRFVVATRQGLFLLHRNGVLTPFARGAGGYVAPTGEPYVALGIGRRVPGAGCAFPRDALYALDPSANPGVTAITTSGRARRFYDLPAGSLPAAIALDTVGRFGYRLLVAAVITGRTMLYALDCHGRARVIVRGAARVEGGAAVAPDGFGRFGGRLIAADELTGRIHAFGARGGVALVARPPRLPAGTDLGVESLGFVPAGLTRRGAAFLADLGAPGSPTEGTDSVLRMTGGELLRAGARPGDLLVATEAGAVTIAVRCLRRCTVHQIGRGPAATHGEGHIAFAR
jgi:hypothetical protein